VAEILSGKRREMLDYIATCLRERGYPPSVREIGEAVGLTSSATVHTHLAVLQREGFLERDPTKPRAIKVRYDPSSREAVEAHRVRNVPLVGDVAAGTGVLAQERVEEVFPLPETFTGTGPAFMLRVRGNSMIDAGILDGDYVVVRHQEDAENGDVVVAGLPDEEATVKVFARKRGKVVLTPANATMEPMSFDADQVSIYGKVLTVLRRL
jgi:repressor LexA